MFKAFIILCLFASIQIIINLLFTLGVNMPLLLQGKSFVPSILLETENSIYFTLSLFISNLVAFGTIWKLGYLRRPFLPINLKAYLPRGIWRGIIPLFFGFLCLVFMVNLFIELLKLPDFLEQTFINLRHNFFFLIILSVLGPFVEEIVFREGILRQLLVKGWNPVGALLFSSFCFSIVHFNPSQIVGAFILGLFLGWLYLRSGDIRLPVFFHILNNSLSAILLYVYGQEQFSLLDWLNTQFPLCSNLTMLGLIATIVLVSIGITIIFLLFWSKKAPAYPGHRYFTN